MAHRRKRGNATQHARGPGDRRRDSPRRDKQTGQWGTEYHPEQDLVRVDAKTETLATPMEQFVIAFEPASAPSAITFAWDKVRYSVPVAKK